MDWSWAVEGIDEEVPRITGPECINYMANRRRWIEAALFTFAFLYITRWAVKRLDPIVLPAPDEINKPHSAVRMILLLAMTFVFGIEMGFKFAGKSVIFTLNPCHIQTLVQIYLLASKPSKTTIALFRIQMNNLNGPFLAFLFPEVESRTYPFEATTYWLQHALLYIIPVYIIRTGAYTMEDISDYNWVTIGVMNMLIYHFTILNAVSIFTDINMNHMLCPALADPFQGQNYRIAAVIHETILCPILNKGTVLLFRSDRTHAADALSIHKKKLSELHIYSRSNQTDEAMYYEQPELVPPTEVSLAAEMAAAMGQPVNAILTRRRKDSAASNETVATSPSHREPDSIKPLSALTTEYSIPTTKID